MNKVKKILYLGWLGKGNVGDDVLFELFKKMFYKYHTPKGENNVVNIDAFPVINHYKTDILTYDMIILGGGSLFHLPYWIKICEEGIRQGIPVVSWGTGFDGAYKEDYFDSFILAQRNNEYFKSIYNQFDYISVRGPLTKKLLNNIGVTKEINEIGDPALAYANEMYEGKLEQSQSKDILINWGTSYNNIFGRNELAIEEELVSVIRALISKGYTVTIYPIWIEDINAVKQLSQKVNDPNCLFHSEVFEAKILQRMIHKSYFSINLKLHANILSAAANRPFISLAYRGKCFDFAKSVNCLDNNVATDEITFDKILNLVEDIENNYEAIVERMHQAKTRYNPKLIESIHEISSIIG